MWYDWLNIGDDPRRWTPLTVAVVTAVIVALGFFSIYGWQARRRFPYERRKAARRRGEAVHLTIATDTDPPEEIGEALVLDRSMGGLGLAVETPLEIGARLRARPRASSDLPWSRLEVKSCHPEQKYWKLSCRFVQLPDWNVIRALG